MTIKLFTKIVVFFALVYFTASVYAKASPMMGLALQYEPIHWDWVAIIVFANVLGLGLYLKWLERKDTMDGKIYPLHNASVFYPTKRGLVRK